MCCWTSYKQKKKQYLLLAIQILAAHPLNTFNVVGPQWQEAAHSPLLTPPPQTKSQMNLEIARFLVNLNWKLLLFLVDYALVLMNSCPLYWFQLEFFCYSYEYLSEVLQRCLINFLLIFIIPKSSVIAQKTIPLKISMNWYSSSYLSTPPCLATHIPTSPSRPHSVMGCREGAGPRPWARAPGPAVWAHGTMRAHGTIWAHGAPWACQAQLAWPVPVSMVGPGKDLITQASSESQRG